MRSFRPSQVWVAGLIALWALLRGLRRLVGAEEGPLALGTAIGVVLVVVVIPSTRGRGQDRERAQVAQGAQWRKAVQLLGAAGVTLLAVYLGAGVVVGGVVGVGAAALVPLAWPDPQPRPGR